jgi:broad-specificity NMP kinase
VFAVLVTGPPGAGKTTELMALSDALVADAIAARIRAARPDVLGPWACG